MNETVKSLVHNKSFGPRLVGTLFLLFTGDADSLLLEILSKDRIPGYQRNLAIWEAGVRREKSLRHILISIVKGEGGYDRTQRLSAVKSLIRIGNSCSEGIDDSLVIDLLEVYLHSMDPKLYGVLHELFLSERQFQVDKFLARAIIERCEFDEEVSAESWEILTRSLHLCFTYRLKYESANYKKGMNTVHHNDKEREKVERTAFYTRKVVDLAREVREDLKIHLATGGGKIIPLLDSPALYRNFQERAGMAKLLKPLLSYILDPRPGIRSIAIKELSDIATPVAYDYYKALILRKTKGFPDTPGQIISVLFSLAKFDSDALDVLLSVISGVCEEEISPLVDGLTKLTSIDEFRRAKIIAEIEQILRKESSSDKAAQELVTRVLGANVTPEVIRFLIEIALDEKTYFIGIRKRAIKVLLKYNRPDFSLYAEITQCIKRLSGDDASPELRQFIFKEIKESPHLDNISFLKEGIFDAKEDVRKGAFRSYCDLVKKSQIGKDDAISFFDSLLSYKSNAMPDIKVQVIDFLKTLPFRDEGLREKIFLLLSHDAKELRNRAFELISLWLCNPIDQEEEFRILWGFFDVLKDPQFTQEDIYTRIARIVSNGLVEGAHLFEKCMKEIFLKIQDALCSPLAKYQIKILCEILDNAGSGKNKTARLQASWIMENLMKKEGISSHVSLHILQFLINKEGKIVQFFPRLMEYLMINDAYTRRVVLEILAGANVFSQKWSCQEKLKALSVRSPREIYEYVVWEASLNKHLLKVLLEILRDPSTEKDVVMLIMAIIRRIECARGELKAIFGYQDARFGDEIRERVLESVAFLMYPPFDEQEMEIISELQKIASDVSVGPNYRLSSLLALVQIGVDEFYNFFLELARNETDRHDIRRLALQGLNIIRNPDLVPFYLNCLKNPRYGGVQRETIIEGLRDIGSASIIEPLLKIVFGGEQDSLQEKARQALVASGYGAAIEIRALYLEIQRKKDEVAAIKDNIQNTRDAFCSTEAQIKKLREEIIELSSTISAEEAVLQKEKKRVAKEMGKWEKQKTKLENRLKELAPEWPNEKKIPKELKEPFLIVKEEYIQFSKKHEQFLDEVNWGPMEKEAKIEEYKDKMRDLVESEGLVELDLNRLSEQLHQYEDRINSLLWEIRQAEGQYRDMGQAFKERVKDIEKENMEKTKVYRESKVREWRCRWNYYTALVKLSSMV